MQRRDFKAALAQRADCLDRGARSGDRRVIGDAVGQRGAPQAETVGDRLDALGGVENQLDPAAAHLVDDIRPAFPHLVDEADR